MALPFYLWSRTAASNATADSTINWAEGMAPSAVNDSGRAMMASSAAFRDDISGALVTAGTSTAYTLTSRQVFDTLAHMDGAMVAFTANATNAVTPTLNIDGLGAKAIVSASGTAIAAGTLIANSPYVVTYNNSSSEFRLQGVAGIVVPQQNYLSGLTLSTAGSSATFAIAAGGAANSTNAALMKLASAYSKTTSAWSLGTAAGSLDTGAIANSTWYHVHLIQRIDTGVVDVLTSLSATAPTMPSNYTLFRRIGSMKTNGSAQWTLFSQVGDEFLWDVPVLDASAVTGDTTAHSLTLTVPTGVTVRAKIGAGGLGGAAVDGRFYISSLDQSDQAAVFANINVGFSGAAGQSWGGLRIRTNTSAQIRYRANSSNGSLYVNTSGWDDVRGRDG